MIKLASMTWQYHEHTFERALEGIAQANFKYVALGLPHQGEEYPNEDDPNSIKMIQSLLQKHQLQPIMLIGNRQFKPDQPLERAFRRLKAAKALGVKEVLSVGTSNYRKFPDGMLTEEKMIPINQKFADHFRMIADHAADLGLILSLKPHTGNTATAKTIMETLKQIDRPNVGGSYDPGNVQYYEGVNAGEDFPQMAARTHSLLIKDHRGGRAQKDFPVPGEGDVDFSKIFSALKQADFTGNVVVERVSTGFSEAPEIIDEKMIATRKNLEKLLKQTGFEFE